MAKCVVPNHPFFHRRIRKGSISYMWHILFNRLKLNRKWSVEKKLSPLNYKLEVIYICNILNENRKQKKQKTVSSRTIKYFLSYNVETEKKKKKNQQKKIIENHFVDGIPSETWQNECQALGCSLQHSAQLLRKI